MAGTVNNEGCGQGTGTVCYRHGGRHPPTPMTHHQRANQHVLRVPPCGFRDCWGIAVRTAGWGWAERKASLSISGPIPCLQLQEPRGHVASLCALCPAPPGGLRASGWAGGWSIIRANMISGEASLPLTMAFGDTGHGHKTMAGALSPALSISLQTPRPRHTQAGLQDVWNPRGWVLELC